MSKLDGRLWVRPLQEQTLCLERPHLAARLLNGQTPQGALDRVAVLFALCGRAQTTALRAALAALHRQAVPVDADLLAAEALQDALGRWRELRLLGGAGDDPALLALRAEWLNLLRQWPQDGWRSWPALPAAAAPAGLPALLQQTRSHLAALLQLVLHGDPDALDADLAKAATADLQALAVVDSRIGRDAPPCTRCLPACPDADALQTFARLMDDDALLARPLWHGLPAETGAWPAALQRPLLQRLLADQRHGTARWLAKIVQIADLLDRLAGVDGLPPLAGSSTCADGAGLGWVQTVRGLLLYRVRCADDGRLREVRQLAPTEWTCHPHGSLAGWLRGRCDGQALTLALTLADPCVGWICATDPAAVC